MEKINIAELLKDCPKGMELDCTMYENVILNYVSEDQHYPIGIKTPDGDTRLNAYGRYFNTEHAKCVIFPKGKTTWEGFVPPCQFKDGDIVFVTSEVYFKYIAIFKQIRNNELFVHCFYSYRNDIFGIQEDLCDNPIIRFATEEEKQKLFQTIKDNGYKWNPATKTLEKLPKFKVGDRIRHKCEKFRDERTVISYGKSGYWTSINDWIDYENQDNWELIPNKFDISTLVPFESRVLVRDNDHGEWRSSFWGHLRQKADMKYDTIRGVYRQCIPYEGNEHLLGSNNDCEEYYKVWEK